MIQSCDDPHAFVRLAVHEVWGQKTDVLLADALGACLEAQVEGALEVGAGEVCRCLLGMLICP